VIQVFLAHRPRLVTIALLLAGVFILAGCQSTPSNSPVRRFTERPGEFREEVAPAMVDQHGVSGIVEFVPPEKLIEEYGKGYENPFVAPIAILSPLEFMVFRVTITDMEPDLVLSPHDTELRFGGRTEKASPPSTLERFWEVHDSNAELRASERTRRRNLIYNETHGFDIHSGDEPVSGLVVFMGRFVDYGPVEVRVPIIDPEENRIIEYVTAPLELK
jgi:hypothetical protein